MPSDRMNASSSILLLVNNSNSYPPVEGSSRRIATFEALLSSIRNPFIPHAALSAFINLLRLLFILKPRIALTRPSSLRLSSRGRIIPVGSPPPPLIDRGTFPPIATFYKTNTLYHGRFLMTGQPGTGPQQTFPVYCMLKNKSEL